jgi:hypothetical protein
MNNQTHRYIHTDFIGIQRIACSFLFDFTALLFTFYYFLASSHHSLSFFFLISFEMLLTLCFLAILLV